MNRTSLNPELVVGSLTYRDYLLAAAQELGHVREDADGEPLLPTDKAELAQCRRAVSRAIREWCGAHPNGWRVLRRRASFVLSPSGTGPQSIGGSAARYRMPPDFNGPAASQWDLSNGSEGGIPVVAPSEFDQQSATTSPITSIPSIATFRRVSAGDSGSSGGAFWEAEFWPVPSSAYRVTIGYEAWVEGMAHETNIFQPGPPYDRSLEDMVVWIAAREARKPEDIVDSRRTRKDESLAAAIAFDRRTAPVLIGTLPKNDYGHMNSAGYWDDGRTVVFHAAQE